MSTPTNRQPFTAGDQVCQDIFTNLPGGGAILPSFNGAAADPPPVEFSVPQRANNLAIVLNVSVISGAGATITFNLDAWDKVSQTWVPGILVSAGLVATGPVVQRIGPYVTPAANVAAQFPMFETFRLRPVRSGTTTTLVYSASANFS